MDAQVEILDASGKPLVGGVLTLVYDDQTYHNNPSAWQDAEAPHQIFEATEYEYELPQGWTFEQHPAVSPSTRHPNIGRLRTGNLVGLLRLNVFSGENAVGYVEFQICSKKIGAKQDYQKMLEDIAEAAAELAMSISEFTYQNFEVDPSLDRRTRYEQFAFVRSLIASDSFKAAIGKICSSPLMAMKDVEENLRADSLRRMGRDVIRQLASGANRIDLPAGHPLRVAGVLKDIPRYVRGMSREETVDVPENRFVKHA